MNTDLQKSILRAFRIENERLATEETTRIAGHPFSVSTNVARWTRDTFFPEHGRITGYDIEDNPFAEIGQGQGGHDFLVVGEWIVDPWSYSDQFININQDPEKVLKLYGDISSWTIIE